MHEPPRHEVPALTVTFNFYFAHETEGCAPSALGIARLAKIASHEFGTARSRKLLSSGGHALPAKNFAYGNAGINLTSSFIGLIAFGTSSESAKTASHADANDFDARQMLERTSRAFGIVKYKVGMLPVYCHFIA